VHRREYQQYPLKLYFVLLRFDVISLEIQPVLAALFLIPTTSGLGTSI